VSENKNNEERLHALLCATLLDEASPEERAEVEQALAASPELCAERERLAATIGLVRTTLPDAESLSDGATAELVAAALRNRMHVAWYRTPAFRIAAALLVAVGGWAAYATWNGGGAEEMLVAKYESAPADARSKTDSAAAPDMIMAGSVLRPETMPPTATLESADSAIASDSLTLGFSRSDENGNEVADQEWFELTGQLKEVAVETLFQGEGAEGALQGRAELHLPIAKVLDPAAGEVLDSSRFLQDQLGLDMREAARRLQAEEAFVGVLTSGGTAGGGQFPSAAPQGTPGPAAPGSPRPAGGGGGIAERLARVREAPAEPMPDLKAVIDVRGYHFGDEKNEEEAPATSDRGEVLEDLGALGYFDGDEAKQAGRDDFYLGRGARQADGRFQPTPEQLDLWLERWKQSCRRRPDEKPRDMFFRFWGDNPFEYAATDRLSTFSVDVDTASYVLARRYLRDGHLPEKAQVRTEEFVNYFKPDLAPPTESTFAIHTELAPSLFSERSDAWLLRVGIRGKQVSREERQPLALTFVVDVSGSMKEENRLELVKHSLRLLLTELDARDAISIVAFSNEARLVLPMASAASRGLIESAIHPLSPDGGTNAEAGLKMGYEQALAALTRGAHNRVVLLSDGVANIGQTDQDRINSDVARHRQSGIYLNTVGVGMDNHNDVFLEQLADKGDGICNYVDDEQEARRALVDNFTGAFEPIARDVKVQVEFDPAQVDSYRLLGYENRAVADQDFRNEAVDAGEVGAGHHVIALYELIRVGSSGDGPLATVRLRWKAPHAQGVATQGGDEATEIAQPVSAGQAAGSFAATSAGYRRSVLVAQFAEFLRRSFHARNDSLERLIDETKRLVKETKDAETAEFLALVELSKALLLERQRQYDGYQRYLDEYGHNCYWQAWIEARRIAGYEQQNAELEARNAELERKIRAILHERYGHGQVRSR
jgi:Ca-activated chloride channel family protein